MKKLILALSILFPIVGFSQKYSRVKINTNEAGLQQLAELGVAVDHGERKRETFFISDFSEYEIEIMENNGFNYEILIDDVKAYYRKQNDIGGTENKNATCAPSGGGNFVPEVPANFYQNSAYAGFYTYQDMLDALDAMVAQYPNLITVKAPVSTFLTYEGRPIYHVKISDNPATDETSEPNVLYTAIHHAREPLSMSQTLFFMWYLLENYASNEEVQFLVDNTELYFVPCLNPDGYIHNETTDPNGGGMHRKNKAPVGTSNPGVDLNRNYSYGWNTTGVSPNPDNDTYPGTSAFSESETQAMKWLIETYGFVSAFNAHTYGNTLLYPIGTTTAEFADHHDYFADLATHMCVHNGYFPQKSSGLYPASGDSDDYAYKVDIGVGLKDTIFAQTPEIGTSFWPAQSQILPSCIDMFFPNMVLAHIAHKYLVVKDEDPSLVNGFSGNFNHSVLRLGRENGSVTVSIEPLINVQSVGSPVVYNLDIRESASGAISYVLDPAIQFGDPIQFVLNTEYGTWTKRDTITKTYGSLTLQLADDATSTSNWTGNWTTTTDEAYSPTTSFTESSGSDYADNANKTFMLTQNIDLTDATDAMITFWAMWEIEADYDYCQFQVSTNGGASWIGQCGLYTVEGSSTPWNGSAQPDGEPVWEGTSGWVREEISLSDYLGQSIKVRFQFESDGGVTQDGFYFDDFEVAYNESAGIDENDQIKVLTFPNPADTYATVSLSQVISAGDIKVYDRHGRLVQRTEVKEQMNQIKLNTSELAEGIYMIVISNGVDLFQPAKLVVFH